MKPVNTLATLVYLVLVCCGYVFYISQLHGAFSFPFVTEEMNRQGEQFHEQLEFLMQATEMLKRRLREMTKSQSLAKLSMCHSQSSIVFLQCVLIQLLDHIHPYSMYLNDSV